MRKIISDHPATFAMLAALGFVLGSLIVLSSEGIKADGPVLLGLVSTVGVLGGGIVGKQGSAPNAATAPPPPAAPPTPPASIATPAPATQSE